MRRARLSVPLALLCGLSVLAGCRPGTALHSRYSNFRAYYNTYYNAERKLEEGEATLDQTDRPIDRTRLVELFPQARAQGGGSGGPFQEAIEKSAELLRDRPGSKWADDALLLIGKAYFYQNNVVGAEQKFRETAAAAEARGAPRLAAEARFWLGRTLAAAERYDEGVQVLQDATARPDADRRWQARLALALGELYARAGRWDVAAEALRAGADGVDDRDLAARGYLLLGQVEEKAADWDAAVEAYALADARAGTYETRYAARVGRALVLGLDAGRQDEALALVRQMRRDDKNYQRRAEVELVYARLLAAAGEADRADDRFRAVLYDEALAGSSVRGQAHYRLGEFFRDVRDDYVRAAAHFDSAATSLRSQALRPGERATRAALLDAPATAQTYSGIATTLRRIEEVDSLLALGALSDEDFAARIQQIEAERLRQFRLDQRRADRLREAGEFGGGLSTPGIGRDDRGSGRQSAGTTPATATGAEAGFLNFRDPTSVQAGRIAFVQVWGDRPRRPNWRRRAAIEASAIATTQGGGGGDLGLSDATESGLRPLDLSPVPRTPEKRDELTVELAGLRYQLGNAYFLSIGLPERAAALYRSILDEAPDGSAAVRARYALAEIETAEGRTAEAEALYRAVADNTVVPELALAARVRLGEVLPEPEVVDTSDAYDRIRAQWLEGDPVGAATAFVAVADAAPDLPNAPRMYFAAASAYTEWAVADSIDLLAPLPSMMRSTVLLPDSAFGAPRGPDAPEPGRSPLGRPGATPAESGTPVSGEAPVPGEAPLPADDEPAPASAAETDGSAAPTAAGDSAQPTVGDLRRGAETPVGPPAPDVPAAPESDVPAAGAAPRLDDYLAALVARYPGTAAAERAAALRSALPQPEPEVPDAPAETDAPDDPEPPVATVDPFADEPVYGYRGGRPIDLARGGFTWLTQQIPDPTAAQAVADAYGELGYRSGVFLRGAQFVVVVGQFETEADADNTIEEFPDGIELDEVEVVALDALAEPVGDAQGDEPDAAPPADDELPAAPPVPTFGLDGDAPIQPGAGGFTWRLRSSGSAVELYGASEMLRRQGVRGGTLTVGDAVWLVVGQFETAADAEAARDALPDVATDEEPVVVPLQPPPPADGGF